MRKLICLLLALAAICMPALAEEGLTAFSTTDMEGNAVTQDIFADYDLTLVNIWATWCPYCIEEMPSFAELVNMLPENVNFITICTDAAEQKSLTEDILRESGANFQTLVGSGELYDLIAAQVTGFPTTFFLDSAGKPAAQPLVGAPPAENPAEIYYQAAMGVLGMLEG